MFKYYLIGSLAILFVVTACGQSGPLYLSQHPSQPQPQHKEASSHVD